MDIIQDKYYPFKVWAATIFVGALLQMLFIVVYLGQGGINNFFSAFAALLFFSVLLSIPTLIIFFAAYGLLNPIIKSELLLKILLLSICIILLFLTDYSIKSIFNRGYEHIKSKFFILHYSLCILISGFYFGRTD